MPDVKILLKLWAKCRGNPPDEVVYPLLYHMLDTFAVCGQIWQTCLHSCARKWISGQLHLPEKDASRWIAFWAGLHDIGKASPDFQGNSEVVKNKLEKSGYKFNRKGVTYHGTATACILQILFNTTLEPELAKKISITVGGHPIARCQA